MTLVAIALMCAALVANGFVLRLRYRVVAAAKAGDGPSVAVSRLRLRQGLIAAFASVSVILSGVAFHSTGFPGDAGVVPLFCWIFGGLEMVVALSQLEASGRARRRRPQWRLMAISPFRSTKETEMWTVHILVEIWLAGWLVATLL